MTEKFKILTHTYQLADRKAGIMFCSFVFSPPLAALKATATVILLPSRIFGLAEVEEGNLSALQIGVPLALQLACHPTHSFSSPSLYTNVDIYITIQLTLERVRHTEKTRISSQLKKKLHLQYAVLVYIYLHCICNDYKTHHFAMIHLSKMSFFVMDNAL